MTGNAILTGSRVYGQPREDSDLDLVVKVDDQTRSILMLEFGEFGDAGPDDKSRPNSIKVGKLNLILADDTQFDVWVRGTQELKERATRDGPISRSEAARHFSVLRLEAGIEG